MATRISAGASNTYNFKIVLLGEGCVGKTSCVLRYVEDAFNDKHLTTLQVNLFSRYDELRIAKEHQTIQKKLITQNHILF